MGGSFEGVRGSGLLLPRKRDFHYALTAAARHAEGNSRGLWRKDGSNSYQSDPFPVRGM